jgi:hypothetical protein
MEIVCRTAKKFAHMNRGYNARFPSDLSRQASIILLCNSAADVADALDHCKNARLRPTVRSGGHCYEGLVYDNPGGAIIDVRGLNSISRSRHNGTFRIEAGATLGMIYKRLKERWNVTLPAGSCAEVGAGGHICGGGYGNLSRSLGLSSDWLSAVDVVGINGSREITTYYADQCSHPDLFRACRGAGGGNFGIVTAFYFDVLPKAPAWTIKGKILFDWKMLTRDSFVNLLTIFGQYCEVHGQKLETWPLFAILELTHNSSDFLTISFHFSESTGGYDVLATFITLFDNLCPAVIYDSPHQHAMSWSGRIRARKGSERFADLHLFAADYPAGEPMEGDTSFLRRKYKSSYWKKCFWLNEIECIYNFLTTPTEVDLSRFRILLDLYGGAINNEGLKQVTSVWKRNSVMKVQFISSWENPRDDVEQLKWIRRFYDCLFSLNPTHPAESGAPFEGTQHQGCYINYPDTDLLRFPNWLELYYGKSNLYSFLQDVKRQYDPWNVFNHALSIES